MKEIIGKRLSLTLRGDWTQRDKLKIIFREEQIPADTPFTCHYNKQADTTNLLFIIKGSTLTGEYLHDREEIAKLYGVHTL